MLRVTQRTGPLLAGTVVPEGRRGSCTCIRRSALRTLSLRHVAPIEADWRLVRYRNGALSGALDASDFSRAGLLQHGSSIRAVTNDQTPESLPISRCLERQSPGHTKAQRGGCLTSPGSYTAAREIPGKCEFRVLMYSCDPSGHRSPCLPCPLGGRAARRQGGGDDRHGGADARP